LTIPADTIDTREPSHDGDLTAEGTKPMLRPHQIDLDKIAEEESESKIRIKQSLKPPRQSHAKHAIALRRREGLRWKYDQWSIWESYDD